MTERGELISDLKIIMAKLGAENFGSLTIFANSLIICKDSVLKMEEIGHVKGKSFDGSE